MPTKRPFVSVGIGDVQSGGQQARQGRTLVMYVYSGTDPEYEHNLRHFVQKGIQVLYN